MFFTLSFHMKGSSLTYTLLCLANSKAPFVDLKDISLRRPNRVEVTSDTWIQGI